MLLPKAVVLRAANVLRSVGVLRLQLNGCQPGDGVAIADAVPSGRNLRSAADAGSAAGDRSATANARRLDPQAVSRENGAGQRLAGAHASQHLSQPRSNARRAIPGERLTAWRR